MIRVPILGTRSDILEKKPRKKGDSKTWKSCCNHAATDSCHSGCELAETAGELVQHCRQSDEMYLFDCVEIKQEREECCGLARKPECHNMCRRWVMSPMQVSKSLLANTCNSPVINCLSTLIPRVPLRQPHKYLHCCEHSNVPSCKDACRSSLKKQSGVDLDRLQENLDAAGCTAVSIHDKMWQCFLRSNQDPPIGNYEDPKPMHAVQRMKPKPGPKSGLYDAKLHCCKKAAGSHCKKLCTKIFTGDFDWEAYESTCATLEEENMNQCLDEVAEPCAPGCKNLNFCSIFNNRPLDLFRSCHPDSDRAAKMDYDLWVTEKKLILPNMTPLYVKDIEECSPITWKAVACALQLKPCNRATQSTRICRSNCYKLLNACLDETRLSRVKGAKAAKIAEVCSKFSSSDEDSCVSLDPFLEAMGENVTEQYSMPCSPDPCGPAKFCQVNHRCSKEEQGNCDLTECKTGCPVGQVAAYLVPTDAFVPIPTVVSGKNNCYRICQCKSRVQECESLFCVPQDYCTILPDSGIDMPVTVEALTMDPPSTWHPENGTSGGYPSSYSYPPTRLPLQSLRHGSALFVKCNLCVCFGGEITCSKRNCNDSVDVSEPSFFQLPCYCEPKYQPVCTSTGLTLPNECIANGIGGPKVCILMKTIVPPEIDLDLPYIPWGETDVYILVHSLHPPTMPTPSMEKNFDQLVLTVSEGTAVHQLNRIGPPSPMWIGPSIGLTKSKM
ncbi:hypothetical protein GE061_014099 [Apolygus lucorum]|uniref:Reversion-inducing cysteine-rich protein with Kazal motifs n=1 Tax=Apolygus lucorum TaxID=248454 RepID=A0A8S9XSC6_APOLU|nr:hypothetical protein GE061_014099 [Apolygus lucorum]